MKRRAVALLAVLALGLAVLGVAPAASADDHLGAAYVALGDSEAAGTGNLPYVDTECLRSKKAYPMILAGMAGMPVASSACAGATTQDVIGNPMMGDPGQLGDLGPMTQLVTITAGINNLDWQGVLAACSSAGSDAACTAAKIAAGQAGLAIPGDVATMLGAVRMAAPYAMIVVTGYPMLFGAVTTSCSVGAFQGTPVKFSAQQAFEANAGIAGVNGAIQAGIGLYQQAYMAQAGGMPDANMHWVDVVPGFTGHALCDTGDRWVSGLVSGKATSDRGFHANAPGQKAYAAIIAAAIPN